MGYFLHTAYWGQGFATELVRAALHHGFDTLSLDLIGAFARPENAASTRVLEKCGLRRLGFVAELERDQYAITRAEWLRMLPR